MTTQTMADIFRWIGIAEVFFSIGLMIRLMWRSRELIGGYPMGRKWRWHVWGLGIPWCLYALGVGLEMQSRLGTPLTWRTPIFVGAATIGLVGQVWTKRVLDAIHEDMMMMGR